MVLNNLKVIYKNDALEKICLITMTASAIISVYEKEVILSYRGSIGKLLLAAIN